MPLLFELLACAAEREGTESVATPDCGPGEQADAGGCVPARCGVGPWGDVEPGTSAVYVAEGAAGDGSPEDPFGAVQQALDLAADAGIPTVVVGAGTWGATLRLEDRHDGIALLGRCPELSLLDGENGAAPVIQVAGAPGPAVRIEGLTLTRGYTGLWVEAGEVDARALDVVANAAVGVYAGFGDLSLTDVTLRDAVVDGGFGRGLDVENQATVRATDLRVAGNPEVGVYVADEGTLLVLADSEVSGGDRALRASVAVEFGGRLEASRVRVDGSAGPLLRAWGGGTRVELTEVTLDGATTAPGGVEVGDGAELVGDALEVTDVAAFGLLVGLQGEAQLEGLGVAGVRDGEHGAGAGVLALDGGFVRVTTGDVAGVAAVGVFLDDLGVADLDAVEIHQARPRADGTGTRGIEVRGGGTLTLVDSRIGGMREVGVLVTGASSTAHLDAVEVDGTARVPSSAFAIGVAVEADATVDVRGGAVSGTEGPGGYVAYGGALSADGTELADNRFAGVVVLGGTLTGTDLVVHDNGPDEGVGGGVGVFADAALGPGTVELIEATVGPHPYAGVWVRGSGTYRLVDVTLHGSEGVTVGPVRAHGNAVYAGAGVGAWSGSDGLWLDGTTLADAAGVALLLDGAGVGLGDDTWVGNGVDLWQQGCDALDPLEPTDLEEVPNWVVCPETDLLVVPLGFPALYLTETPVAQ